MNDYVVSITFCADMNEILQYFLFRLILIKEIVKVLREIKPVSLIVYHLLY